MRCPAWGHPPNRRQQIPTEHLAGAQGLGKPQETDKGQRSGSIDLYNHPGPSIRKTDFQSLCPRVHMHLEASLGSLFLIVCIQWSCGGYELSDRVSDLNPSPRPVRSSGSEWCPRKLTAKKGLGQPKRGGCKCSCAERGGRLTKQGCGWDRAGCSDCCSAE